MTAPRKTAQKAPARPRKGPAEVRVARTLAPTGEAVLEVLKPFFGQQGNKLKVGEVTRMPADLAEKLVNTGYARVAGYCGV